MRRGILMLAGILLAACASSGTTAPSSAVMPSDAPPAKVLLPPPASPSPTIPERTVTTTATSSASPSPRIPAGVAPSATTSAPFVKGWPTVSQSGISMTGRLVEEPPPFGGGPGAAPAVTLAIAIKGLAPGESVSLVGSGAYDFLTLGCGVQPSPCEFGSDTTDPAVHLCRPEYAQAAEGTATTATDTTAGADGTAAATLRFVISESERACPAGASRPWYVESGMWKLRVTDRAHGLRLVGPPDLIIGP